MRVSIDYVLRRYEEAIEYGPLTIPSESPELILFWEIYGPALVLESLC